MRVTLCRKPGAEECYADGDGICGDLDPTSGDGWFDPTMIMIHADPACSENPEGDILLFDSVNGKLSLWVERHEFYAQFDGEWRMVLEMSTMHQRRRSRARLYKQVDAGPKEAIPGPLPSVDRLDRPGVQGPVGTATEEEDRLGDCCVNPACGGTFACLIE
jgi:hypothetical protein